MRSFKRVRVHEDPNVVHPEGRVDPLADIETIQIELIYADLEQAERRLERVARTAKSGDRRAVAETQSPRQLIEASRPAGPLELCRLHAAAPDALTLLQPLTAEPVLLVATVDEGSNEFPPAILEYARSQVADRSPLRRVWRPELAELDPEDAAAMRADPRPNRFGSGWCEDRSGCST